MNYALAHILRNLVEYKVSKKIWKHQIQTRRSECTICAYHGQCVWCDQQTTHIACRVDECGAKYNKYLNDPNDANRDDCIHVTGNNKELLIHFAAEHQTHYELGCEYLLQFATSNHPYLDSVLLPIKKYKHGRRKLGIRGVTDKENRSLYGHFGIEAVVTTPEEDQQLPAATQFYLNLWQGEDIRILPQTDGEPLRSRCPAWPHGAECQLQEGGWESTRLHVVHWDHVSTHRVRRYHCTAHKKRKLPADGKKLLIHPYDTMSYAKIRSGNTFVDPIGGQTILTTNEECNGEMSATLQLLIGAQIQRYKQEIRRRNLQSPYSLALMKKVIMKLLPNLQAFTEVIRNLQLEIYPDLNDDYDGTVLRTTPTSYTHDQTFDEVNQLKFDGDTTLKVGMGTIALSYGYWLKFYLLNNTSENFEQIAKALADVKGQAIYFGDPDILHDSGMWWGFDHHRKFQNIGHYIQHEVDRNIEHNEAWEPIADKLLDAGVNASEIKDTVYEWTLHLYNRDYAAGKADGIKPASHRDFVLIPHSKCLWAQSLQHASDDEMKFYPPNHTESPPTTYSKQNARYLQYSATDIYWKYAAILRDDVAKANRLKQTVDAILEANSVSDILERYKKQRQITSSADYISGQQLFVDIAVHTNYHHVGQILGYFVNGTATVDTDWITHSKKFHDERGNEYIFMDHACLQLVADSFMRFFRRDISENDYIPILYPLADYFSMKYQCLQRVLRRKIFEGHDKKTKHILGYPTIRKQVQIAASPLSIEGFINNRHDRLTGIWGNVAAERIHTNLRLLDHVSRAAPKCAAKLLAVEIKRCRTNESVIDHIIRDLPVFFDDTFKKQWRKLRDTKFSRYFDKIQMLKHDSNITKNWSDHIKKTRQFVNHRDIARSNKRVIRKLDMALLNREICLLRDVNMITVDLVAHFWKKFGYSFAIMFRQFIGHNLVSGRMSDDSLVVDPENWDIIREMIQNGEFKQIQTLPPFSNDLSDLRALPEVPAFFSQSQPADTNEEKATNRYLPIPPITDNARLFTPPFLVRSQQTHTINNDHSSTAHSVQSTTSNTTDSRREQSLESNASSSSSASASSSSSSEESSSSNASSTESSNQTAPPRPNLPTLIKFEEGAQQRTSTASSCTMPGPD